ncbi:band 3 anion transport protein-like [Halichondria panicea]|uniref:band 3 anion transport protein-like n=1 Tax=Halichondria panicea TaxID=6063 RepID=UPI00312B73BD
MGRASLKTKLTSTELQVRTWKMHLYTIVQIVCVASLFGVKNSPAGMLYPVIIIALLPLKWVLDRYFYSHDEIEALDSEEDFPEDHTGHREEEFGEFEAHVPY